MVQGRRGGLDEDGQRVLQALLAMQRQSWEQGVASHAFLDLGLDDLADVVARDAVVRQTADGRLAELDEGGIVNSASLGEVVRWASSRHGDVDLAAAFDRQVEWITSGAPAHRTARSSTSRGGGRSGWTPCTWSSLCWCSPAGS